MVYLLFMISSFVCFSATIAYQSLDVRIKGFNKIERISFRLFNVELFAFYIVIP